MHLQIKSSIKVFPFIGINGLREYQQISEHATINYMSRFGMTFQSKTRLRSRNLFHRSNSSNEEALRNFLKQLLRNRRLPAGVF